MADFNPQPLCGWRGIDIIQQGFARQYRRLLETAPSLFNINENENEPVLLYKAYKDVLGDYPPYVAQEIGDCVSHGHGRAHDCLQCIEIALGEPITYKETHTEYIYATSREVAGILGDQDGSYGSAAVKAMQTMGCLSREMIDENSDYSGSYSGEWAKVWGKKGAPDKAKKKAIEYKLRNAALVSTWSELVVAIKNGYPVTICSIRGFSMTRDKDGFCRPEGKWGHCMFIAGLRFDREGACIMQSWGPKVPSGPLALGQPSFSFWVERPIIESILGEGDSWALTGAADFAPRTLPKSWNWSIAA